MSKFYNGDHIIDNKKIFNFIVGSRGVGKTFYFKNRLIDEWVNNKKKFIILRRYIVELDLIKDTFFNDINRFKNIDIIVKGYDIILNGEIIGKFVALSSVFKYKSINMSQFKFIFFDEFLPEDEFYLKQNKNYYFEVESILNFYQSIARDIGESITNDTKVILCSNSISFVNPYFSFFKIDKQIFNGQSKAQGSLYYYEKVDVNLIEESTFYKELKNTAYGQYAFGNEFKTKVDRVKKYEDKYLQMILILNVEKSEVGLFITRDGNLYFKNKFPSSNNKFSLFLKQGYILIRTSKYYDYIYKYLINSKVFFENAELQKIIESYFIK